MTMPPVPPEAGGRLPVSATFGVTLGPVEPVLALHLGLPDGNGVLVRRVEPGSQAEQIGLQQWDVIETVGALFTVCEVSMYISSMDTVSVADLPCVLSVSTTRIYTVPAGTAGMSAV